MIRKRFESLKCFTFYEKLKLVFNLIINRILDSYILIEKKQLIDALLSEGYSFRKEKKLIVITTPENKVLLIRKESSDWDVFIQIFKNKEYLPLIELIKLHNFEPKYIIDAGSNIGLTTIYFDIYFQHAFYYCIEPDANNFKILKENTNLNKINCSVNNYALWNCNEPLIISNGFRDGKSWSLQIIKSEDDNNTQIKTKTLQNIIDEQNISRIDVLKMDIEGSEEVIFNDNRIHNILLMCSFIIIEIHEEVSNKNNILKKLREADFEIFFSGEHTIGYNKKIINV